MPDVILIGPIERLLPLVDPQAGVASVSVNAVQADDVQLGLFPPEFVNTPACIPDAPPEQLIPEKFTVNVPDDVAQYWYHTVFSNEVAHKVLGAGSVVELAVAQKLSPDVEPPEITTGLEQSSSVGAGKPLVTVGVIVNVPEGSLI